jgi:predicted site-specific integrase-resolvase
MAIVSISEAARLTGKSTKTLYRMVSQGRLSVSLDENGTKNVDTSELARVFGTLALTSKTPGETDLESRVRQLEKENAELRHAAELLRVEKASAETVSAERESQLQDMRQAMRLLENAQQAQTKRPWWRFGR